MTSARTVQRITVVGAGAMGCQIAMVAALAGLDVAVHDLDDAAFARARAALGARMQRDVEKGRRSQSDVDAAWARLSFTTDLGAAAEGSDVVVEAAVEKLDVKRGLFTTLDGLVAEHTILASNSSSFVPSRLADATRRPDRVCNMHFFNPALVMKCVEIVPGPDTSEDTTATVAALARRMGKEPVVLTKEIHGFLANRILNAVRDEAIRLYEGGYAGIAEIDTVCRTALGYPMGPFELMDLTGVDIGYHVKLARFEETGDPQDAPSATVTELVRQGRLGRKTGSGFYDYDADGHPTEGAR